MSSIRPQIDPCEHYTGLGLWGVPTADVLLHWPAVKPKLSTACTRFPDFSVDDVLQKLLSGAWHLWISHESVAVCSVSSYPGATVYSVHYAAGDLEDMRDCMEALKEWAASEGYDALDVWGRPGWGRVLAEQGFGERMRVFRARLR